MSDATVTARGSMTKSARTDRNGNFSLKLPAGTYDVSASSRSVMHCSGQRVQVAANRYTRVTIDCDTGIR